MRTAITFTLLLTLAGCVPVEPRASGDVAGLTVAPERSMAEYSRDRFPHWVDQGGGCDTREVVLRRQGVDVVTGRGCKATSGAWVSVYDGVTVADAAELDIDHLVPLAEAWRSGADSWSEARRRAFANDLEPGRLVAVTARSNRAKGDQDPARWLPAESHRCDYVAGWIAVKSAYGLTVDPAEYAALAAVTDACAG